MYHVISSPRPYFGEGGDPMRAFAIWEGGLGIWGAIAFGGVGAWIACRRRASRCPAFADALAPGLLVAQAIGRLGNWFQQRAVRQCHRPAVGAEDLRVGQRPGGARADGEPALLGTFHPTFLYEMLWNWPRPRWWSGPTGASGPATAGPSRCMSRPTALPALDRAPAHRPGRDLLRRAAQRLHLDHRRTACRGVPVWQRGLPRVITQGADHAGRDAAAVPPGRPRNPVREAPVTMVTSRRSHEAFAQAGSDGNRRDPADAPETEVCAGGPVLRLCPSLQTRRRSWPGRHRRNRASVAPRTTARRSPPEGSSPRAGTGRPVPGSRLSAVPPSFAAL